jgi:(2Fe-2S) ferredoxin
MPKRERYLWVCTNERPENHPMGSCARKGSRALLDALKRGVAERGLRERVRVCASSCLDVCWAGMAIAVMPDHTVYGRVQPSDVPEILDTLARGGRVPRLELSAADYDDPAKAAGGGRPSPLAPRAGTEDG